MNVQATLKSPPEKDNWAYQVLGDQNFRIQRGFLAWWNRLTSPPDAPAGASFVLRDRVRRGHVASALMLFLLIVLGIASTIGIFSTNHTILAVIITMFVAILFSIPLNRLGQIEVVGIIMAIGLTGGMYTSMLTAPGGMSPAEKDILYLLFFADMFVAAILPVNFVFLVAGLNIAFSVYALTFAPHTPALTTLLAHGGYATILARLIQIHVIVSGVMWVVIHNLNAACRRANRAEEVARLQHDLAAMAQQQIYQARALEHSITLMTRTLTSLANGDESARIPLTRENILYQICGQVNNLIGRYYHIRHVDQEYQVLSYALVEAKHSFQMALREAVQEQRPIMIQLPATAAPFGFLQALNGLSLVQRTSTSSLHERMRPQSAPVTGPFSQAR
jgi:hypothetical protein